MTKYNHAHKNQKINNYLWYNLQWKQQWKQEDIKQFKGKESMKFKLNAKKKNTFGHIIFLWVHVHIEDFEIENNFFFQNFYWMRPF